MNTSVKFSKEELHRAITNPMGQVAWYSIFFNSQSFEKLTFAEALSVMRRLVDAIQSYRDPLGPGLVDLTAQVDAYVRKNFGDPQQRKRLVLKFQQDELQLYELMWGSLYYEIKCLVEKRKI